MPVELSIGVVTGERDGAWSDFVDEIAVDVDDEDVVNDDDDDGDTDGDSDGDDGNVRYTHTSHAIGQAAATASSEQTPSVNIQNGSSTTSSQ